MIWFLVIKCFTGSSASIPSATTFMIWLLVKIPIIPPCLSTTGAPSMRYSRKIRATSRIVCCGCSTTGSLVITSANFIYSPPQNHSPLKLFYQIIKQTGLINRNESEPTMFGQMPAESKAKPERRPTITHSINMLIMNRFACMPNVTLEYTCLRWWFML